MTELHSLPVEVRIQFKLCLLVHLTLIGKAPTYIMDLLQPVLTTFVSLDSLVFSHKDALPDTEIAPEVWRARLQHGCSQGLKQLVTASPSSLEH